jgi:glycosyltransferase involved in cell wall biosynthesis
MLISVIIPVYNEAMTITTILQQVDAVQLPYTKEIVVVDDFSIDGTREILRNFENNGSEKFKVIYHDKNQGKGAALKSGFALAKGDIIIIQDADLEYDPQDYPRLIKPIVDGKADVVYGSRLSGSGPHRVLYFWHYAGNTFLTLLSNMCTNLNLTDMETGYKAFKKDI